MAPAIAAELAALSGRVAAARAEVDAGRQIVIVALQDAIASLCNRLEAVARTDAEALLPSLIALLDDISHLERATADVLLRLKGRSGGRLDRGDSRPCDSRS